MSKQSNKYISVFIPTYNGETHLAETIEAVKNQKLPAGYDLELMVTDSGSTDRTTDILNAYRDFISLKIIQNTEFGHGKTRQQAAETAKGEYILFLSQDATPSHREWAINMIEPFFVSEKVGCVFGRQIPRPFAVPTIKREVSGVFNGLGAGDAIILHRGKSLVTGRRNGPVNTFFSDVNSAVRKDLIIKVPFRDVPYAEDQALAQDLQDAGYLKAYSSQGSVWHSNDYTAREYYRRKFDEYVGLQESVAEKLSPSKRDLLIGWIRPTLLDWKFTRHDREYTPYLKLKYILLSPAYNFCLQLGKYRAIKYLHDPGKRKRMSLEQRGK
jgi:rhamnosyltransferase